MAIVSNGSSLKISYEDDYLELIRKQEEKERSLREAKDEKKDERSMQGESSGREQSNGRKRSDESSRGILDKSTRKKSHHDRSLNSKDSTWRPHKKIKSEKKNTHCKPANQQIECVILD